ncbi:hypothetical protein NHX12_014929 [Muraenolepis orangiensis]|uniref:Uncharacterized protein n=1 Tax=Muraenolepis orangiensis TaxID=630683 RepID=A0A9Q0D8Z2_9TELE|nr:hypothetical protein NHX12_014929 [Muraenolepis orangiensis]
MEGFLPQPEEHDIHSSDKSRTGSMVGGCGQVMAFRGSSNPGNTSTAHFKGSSGPSWSPKSRSQQRSAEAVKVAEWSLVIADPICSGINHCEPIRPAKKTMAFIGAGQRSTAASRTSFSSLLSTAQDWEMKVVTTLKPEHVAALRGLKGHPLGAPRSFGKTASRKANERKRGKEAEPVEQFASGLPL